MNLDLPMSFLTSDEVIFVAVSAIKYAAGTDIISCADQVSSNNMRRREVSRVRVRAAPGPRRGLGATTSRAI